MSAEYPQHDKLHAVKLESQAQGAFVEWLQARGIFLCKSTGELGDWHPVYESVTQLLAEYHGIDLAKLEKEKRAMLADFQRQSEQARKEAA